MTRGFARLHAVLLRTPIYPTLTPVAVELEMFTIAMSNGTVTMTPELIHQLIAEGFKSRYHISHRDLC